MTLEKQVEHEGSHGKHCKQNLSCFKYLTQLIFAKSLKVGVESERNFSLHGNDK